MIVLCYHAVSPDWPSPLAVSAAALERQVRLLLDRGGRSATLAELIAGRNPRSFAITFDDAYASVAERAFPVLDRLGVRATVFATTAHPDSGRPLSWPGIEEWLGTEWEPELRPSSWDQLRDLAAAGWEVGSHTRTHERLTTLADDALAAELRLSREDCERELGAACTSIAYPYGATDERVGAAAAAAGYRFGAALDGEVARDPDPMRWPRLGVYPADGDLRFRAKAWAFGHGAVWNALQRIRGAARRVASR
jgi:peptidoglycan/xylan/chitin deacetylase (PgdA/CDA1 family)